MLRAKIAYRQAEQPLFRVTNPCDPPTVLQDLSSSGRTHSSSGFVLTPSVNQSLSLYDIGVIATGETDHPKFQKGAVRRPRLAL